MQVRRELMDLLSPHPANYHQSARASISLAELCRLLGEESIVFQDKDDGIVKSFKREDVLLGLLKQANEWIDFFRAVFLSIPRGIIVVSPQGDMVEMNDSAQQMLDLDPQDLKAHSLARYFHPERIEKALSGEMMLNQVERINGRWVLVDYCPVQRENREIQEVILIVQDLPKVAEIAKELDHAQELNKDLNAILSTIYDEILVVNAKGELLRHSQTIIRDFWHVDLPSLIGKNLVELEEQGVFSPSVTRLVLERKRKVSVIQETRQGKKVLAVGTPVFDERGKLERIVIASRDITETVDLKKELRKKQREIESLKQRMAPTEGFVFKSPRMYDVLSLIEKVARYPTTVLITGESGVGKEVVAKLIHRSGPRAGGPFLKVNCGAIPEHLLESELFGYERGAFTGADPRGKKGYFVEADGGVLFLDEIAELPLSLQAKLLRVLQEREVTPVGSTRPIPIDVQIITATNKDLPALVREQKFREDLYYRINVVPIAIPPLRERPEDIMPLTLHFMQKFNRIYGRNIQIGPEAMHILESYHWPGNARELQNLIERLVVTAERDDEWIEPYRVTYVLSALSGQVSFKSHAPFVQEIMPLKKALEHVEEQLILMAMQRYRSTTMAAKALGISQPSVSRKYQRILQKMQNNKI